MDGGASANPPVTVVVVAVALTECTGGRCGNGGGGKVVCVPGCGGADCVALRIAGVGTPEFAV